MTATFATGIPGSKYAFVAGTAARQALVDRSATLGRVAFYGVILAIFSRLWQVIIGRGALEGASAMDLLWYLALTEWVVLAMPPVHLWIEQDIRSGDIAYQLPRPMSYPLAKLAEAGGEIGVRLAVLGVAGLGFAWLYAGGAPEDPRGLWLAIPIGVLATWVMATFMVTIGLTAFWLQDCSPIYWIWQKCAFILGGLMIPLEVYPDWLRGIAVWTPFASIMHGTGRMAFGLDLELAVWTAAKLIVWGILATGLLAFVYARALKALDLGGG